MIRLNQTYGVFNLGDTSFRRKSVLSDCKVILQTLAELQLDWDTKNTSQIDFYKDLVTNKELVESTAWDEYVKLKKMGHNTSKCIEDIKKRSRTITNSVLKLGFINEKRQLTEVGEKFLAGEIQPCTFESMLHLSSDNLFFLRQLLKLQVVNKNGKNIYPFRCVLLLLCHCDTVPLDELKGLILSLRPGLTDTRYKSFISKYNSVKYSELIDEINDCYEIDSQETPSAKWPKEDFFQSFTNRKSTKTIEDYWKFYEVCYYFWKNKNEQNFNKLKELSSLSTIKKAFGNGSTVFQLNNKKFKLLNNFISSYEAKLFKQETINSFNKCFYTLFFNSKQKDLCKEYGDVFLRTIKVTGLISTQNNQASLTNPVLIKTLLNVLGEAFVVSDEQSDDKFEKTFTTSDILGISSELFKKALSEVRKELNIAPNINLGDELKRRQYQEFLNKIHSMFDDKKLSRILCLFKDYPKKSNEEEIKKAVTESSTLPTIFEYILGIVWHRLCGENFNLKESLNLSLDGDYLPLLFAPGGEADVIAKVNSIQSYLVLEATLMDPNNQRRNEMEPVIRHVTNVTARSKEENYDTYGIFVAPKIDANVAMVFRACSGIELANSQNKSQIIQGIKILPLSVEQVNQLFTNKTPLKKITTTMDKLKPKQMFYKFNAYDEIVKEVLL